MNKNSKTQFWNDKSNNTRLTAKFTQKIESEKSIKVSNNNEINAATTSQSIKCQKEANKNKNVLTATRVNCHKSNNNAPNRIVDSEC